MKKLIFFALTVSINLAFAESAPYKWTRNVSKVRTLRGVNQDILVSEVKDDRVHLKAECEKK